MSGSPRAPARKREPFAFQPVAYARTDIGSAVVSVAVVGDLDAHNARGLAEYIDANVDGTRRLIVDLQGLTLFGTRGFSALHYVNVTCSRRAVTWVAVPGPEVTRLLRICDPEGALPVANSFVAAVAAVAGPSHTHLRPTPS